MQDFGTEWTNLTQKANGRIAAFWDFDWGAALTHTDPSKQIENEVIFATVYEETSAMKGPYPGWDKDLHFVRSDDLFETKHQKLIACGNQFEIVAHRVRKPSNITLATHCGAFCSAQCLTEQHGMMCTLPFLHAYMTASRLAQWPA